jgi:hypothetical protein
MRLLRRAPLLLALSLFTSAGTAHAECAWVLWSHFTLRDENAGCPTMRSSPRKSASGSSSGAKGGGQTGQRVGWRSHYDDQR